MQMKMHFEKFSKRMLLILVACVVLVLVLVDSGKVKVVEAPFSFNNPLGANPASQDQEKKLISRVDPETPSGPQYLIDKLNGKCFIQMENNYKYEFCPFHNVTQREQTYRWNSFHGILGVWKHWSVSNGTFVSMEMMHGEYCVGIQERQISVVLRCGEENKIISVHEPETCKYRMIFKTPYACPVDVFQVYPVLSDKGKRAWQEVEKDYADEMLTELGYDKRLKEILIEEELFVEDRKTTTKRRERVRPIDPSTTTSVIRDEDDRPVRDITDGFISRHQCVQEFEKLYLEVRSLRNKLKDFKSSYKNNGSSTVPKETVASGIKIGKYKRGELGEKSINTKTKRQRTSNEKKPPIEVDTSLSKNTNSSRSNPKRGEIGLVDEEKHPSRHLQDRMHEVD